MQSRFVVAALSVFITLPLLAANSIVASTQFIDVPANAWFTPYIQRAVDVGIVSGYKDQYGNVTGRFGPENPVTVGEALKIALEGADYDISRGVGFGHFAAKHMSIAIGLGFQMTQVQGLNLDRPATRAEVSSLIVDAFLLDRRTFTTAQYRDISSDTPYAASILALSKDGIVTGDTDLSGNLLGLFRPNALVNRAEAVKIVMGARTAYGTPGRNIPQTSSYSSRSSSSRSSGSCSIQECGLAPGMPNWQCPNGSIAGPSCERLPDTRCAWLIRQCAQTSSSSSRSSSSSSKYKAQTYIIQYTDNGFQPSFIAIRVGDIVKFRNQSTAAMWVASNPHPAHADYAEFDERSSVNNGGEFSFTFTRVGVWGFHNHLRSSHQAVLSVDPQ